MVVDFEGSRIRENVVRKIVPGFKIVDSVRTD